MKLLTPFLVALSMSVSVVAVAQTAPAPRVSAGLEGRAVPMPAPGPASPSIGASVPLRAARVGPVSGSAFATPLEPRYRVGQLIADGSAQKTAYLADGNSKVVIRVLRPLRRDAPPGSPGAWARTKVFEREYTSLEFLKARGFPVMNVVEKGSVMGLPADVVERFDVSSKDAVAADGVQRPAASTGMFRWKELAPKLFDANSKKDLLQIRNAIEGGVAISDFQVLLKPGKVVVFDPGRIILKDQDPGAYAQLRVENLRVVDDMLHSCP